MPEPVSAAKTKSDPHKQPVRAPAPDTEIVMAAPEVETPIQGAVLAPNLSPRQLLQLQRTMGNKAVASMLRASKPSAPTVQRDIGITSPISVKPVDETTEKGAVPNSDVMATEAEKANPVLALKTYREAVGVHLREGKRHKFKIERYKAFIQADFVHILTEVPSIKSADAALTIKEALPNQPAKELKKLKKERETLNERKKKVGDVNTAEGLAEARIQKALNASTVAESELPLIEYAYDTLVQMRHDDLEGTKHGMFFGSGNPYERARVHRAEIREAEENAASILNSPKQKAKFLAKAKTAREMLAKQQGRIDTIEQAKKDLIKAQTLRGQAKLSEDVMAVKRKQLKAEKAQIKGVDGRAVTLSSHLGSKVVSAVGGAVVSTATLGLLEVEQNKAEGGYSSKREYVSIIDTWKRDWAVLKSVWATRPYGKLTALHLFFQGLGTLILKPLRKVFTAAALIFTGLSLIPPLAIVTGPLAAFCTLVTLGLVAAKMALDAVLATWSALTLALNKNAHNTDVLRAQTAGQAADVAAGAVAVGAAFGVPAIGNAVGGNYVNPLQNLNSKGGSIMNYNPGSAGTPKGASIGQEIGHQAQVQGAKLPATLGLIVGEKVINAAAELEGLGPGAKALFQVRQKEILARNLPGPESYMAMQKAKLEVLLYQEGHLKKRLAFREAQVPPNPSDIERTRKSIAVNAKALIEVRTNIASSSTGASAPMAAPSAPTTAPLIDAHPGQTAAIPAQGRFAAHMNPEVEKERTMREASTKALGAKAKAQVQGLISGIGQSQTEGAALVSGSQAAVSGVAAAGPSQGVQPVDGTNASVAQENIGAGQDILQQVLAVAQAAPSAVDEAIMPAPVSGGSA